jgi:hypothetical protein
LFRSLSAIIVLGCLTFPKSSARRDDLIATLAFALTPDSRLARMQSAELLASIVAERIVDRLEASGYVVMQAPPAPGAGDRPRP